MAFPWLYLTAGLAWLLFGLAILTGWISGPWTTITVRGSSFSNGWVAVALGLYNLVRWYHRQGLAKARAWERDQNLQRQKVIERLQRDEPPAPTPLSPL